MGSDKQQMLGDDTPFYDLLHIDYDSPVKKVGNKYYLVDGVKYDKVTSILHHIPHPQLEAWYKRSTKEEIADDTAINLGKQVHTAIETKLKTGVFDENMWGIAIAKRMHSFQRWREEYNITFGPYTLEAPLYSHTWGVAGTADFTGYIDGELTIADWKTGNGIYDTYAIQVATYMHFYKEITGEEPKKGLIVCLQDEKVLTQVIPSFTVAEDLFQIFTSCVNMYRGWKEMGEIPLHTMEMDV